MPAWHLFLWSFLKLLKWSKVCTKYVGMEMGHKKICFYVKMCVREKSLNSIIDDVEKKTRLYRPHTWNNKKKVLHKTSWWSKIAHYNAGKFLEFILLIWKNLPHIFLISFRIMTFSKPPAALIFSNFFDIIVIWSKYDSVDNFSLFALANR